MEDRLVQFIAIVLLLIVAAFIGYSSGRGKVCDAIRPAVLDSPRVRAVIINEFYDGYLKQIEKVCRW